MRSMRRGNRSRASQQQIAVALANLDGDPEIAPERHPLVAQAQAALDRAQLDLSYTVITAPADGVVAKVEQLQVGDYIAASAPVFALVSTRDVWIEANFKEVQLAHMRPGNPRPSRSIAIPGRKFSARGDERESEHGFAVFAAAAGERDRQLGQGRAARARARCT